MSDICVFSTPVEPMADMAVDLLMGEGIPARKSIAYREMCPWAGNDYGMIGVLVPEHVALSAVELLNVRFSDTGDVSENGREDEENETGN